MINGNKHRDRSTTGRDREWETLESLSINGMTILHSSRLRSLHGRGSRKIVRTRVADDFKDTVLSGHNGAGTHVNSETGCMLKTWTNSIQGKTLHGEGRGWHKLLPQTRKPFKMESCWERGKHSFSKGVTLSVSATLQGSAMLRS